MKSDKSGSKVKKPSKIKRICLAVISFFTKALSKIFFKILLLLFLLASVFFATRLGWQKLIEVKTEKSHALVFRELERCSELITAKTTYTDIISIKKTRIAGFAKSFSIIKYTGVIRGGILDIGKSKITVTKGGKVVKVELPPVEVLSNDISQIEVFDESRSIFVSISVKEIMEEIRFNQETSSAQILETGFLDEARKQACKIIESILYAAGFEEVTVI